MSLSASEKRDCGKEPSDLQDDLVRVLTKAVQELELNCDPPQEPAKSKLNSWFFAAGHRQTGARSSMPFFPNVHEQVVKAWSAPVGVRPLGHPGSVFQR